MKRGILSVKQLTEKLSQLGRLRTKALLQSRSVRAAVAKIDVPAILPSQDISKPSLHRHIIIFIDLALKFMEDSGSTRITCGSRKHSIQAHYTIT
jgi:hypothetical protein